MQELLDKFTQCARKSQLLVVEPDLLAMVYAVNSKKGCFTGFTQIRCKSKNYNYLDFLAA